MPEDKKAAVAYVPFKTFLAAIEGFERHMPEPIDNSAWPTYSGAIKSQLLGAFRFLGLIDDKGTAMPALKSLVEDKAHRKANLRKIMEASYKPLIAAGLQNMSPKRFDELMGDYGMQGETHNKVVSFFIKAARYAELPISPLLLRRGARPITARKRKHDEGGDEGVVGISVPQTSSGGTSKTVDLVSGGQLTVVLSVNLLDLNASDREFVFGIIDKVQSYKGKEGVEL
jgi:hypothetical protein